MATAVLKPEAIRAPLRGCGYRDDLLREGIRFGNGLLAPLVGFAQAPADSRSACIAVINGAEDPELSVDACRPLGAPVIFVCSESGLQWWKQGVRSAEYLETITRANIERFFHARCDELAPNVVYRAKTWGRFKTEYQLSFVDLGLMQLVEEEVGRSLGTLIERNVSDLKHYLSLGNFSEARGQWLLQTVFWLVSGKILHDKQVRGFSDLNLENVKDVFARLAAHYDVQPLPIRDGRELLALQSVAQKVKQFSSLALTTTESLAYVYENTLISKETRTELGTHSTPSFLVDYVVGNLADWISEIPVERRGVFEPACGHAAFLVSALRLFTELLSKEQSEPRKRGPYLRSRLHGSDIDPFALELARLSLTLTDIPNPNGWDLAAGDMFLGEGLANRAKTNTILLANPPFDNFSLEEQDLYNRQGIALRYVNKAAEMLWRTLPHLPPEGLFGVVLPQSILHNSNSSELRRVIIDQFELREICLFPDKVFPFSDAESMILLGRRRQSADSSSVRYRRVRERELPSFRTSYQPSSETQVSQEQFRLAPRHSMRVPELQELWNFLASNPSLAQVADTGQGLIYHGEKLPPSMRTYSDAVFPNGVAGFIHFDQGLQLHDLPKTYWLNLESAVIRRAVSGTAVGVPQLLVNYAPSSRGPWRLKALIDRKGHPVSSRFITVRPHDSVHTLEYLWAVLNSPLANAYVFSHLGKRDNVVGDIRRLPLPAVIPSQEIEGAVRTYLVAVRSGENSHLLRELLLDIDCKVLKLYRLPSSLERLLLNVFCGWGRVGVPFVQDGYFPKQFRADASFSEFRKLDADWDRTNRERGLLIDKKLSGSLTQKERARLELLQAYAEYHITAVAPRPRGEIEAIRKELLARKLSRSDAP